MATPPIDNPFKGTDLGVVELTDRSRIQFWVSDVAAQINKSRQDGTAAAPHVPNSSSHVKDLDQYIADIIYETTVQGASMLEVHVIDPAWALLRRDKNGNCFFDVDDQGYLWPPIDVNFPPKTTDSVWRLAQLRPSSDLNAPNMILTFEDKIVAQLREHHGPFAATASQTRAEFIQSIVQRANKSPNPGDVKIRFKHLLDPSTFTQADLGLSTPPPASSPRRDASKQPVSGSTVRKLVNPVLSPSAQAAKGVEISITAGVQELAGVLSGIIPPPIVQPHADALPSPHPSPPSGISPIFGG